MISSVISEEKHYPKLTMSFSYVCSSAFYFKKWQMYHIQLHCTLIFLIFSNY